VFLQVFYKNAGEHFFSGSTGNKRVQSLAFFSQPLLVKPFSRSELSGIVVAELHAGHSVAMSFLSFLSPS